MYLIRQTFCFFLLFFVTFSAFAQKPVKEPAFLTVDSPWADSVFQTLTPPEKIGQLFMVAAYSNRDQKHVDELLSLIENQKIGGLIFFQGGPVRQAKLTNLLQSRSSVPLWIGMDAEWGLGMRLDSTLSFPRQLTLGALRNNDLIYNMGAEIARQFQLMGMHVSFSPVVDVNNNPQNPVINNRSFGEDKKEVAEKGIAYMRGLQEHRVLANAKHFPGHGDTDTDSHKDLPVIEHDRKRIENVELYPFKKLIDKGLASVMVAHLNVPALDSTPNLPSTLSAPIVTGLLRKDLGFDGIIFTDALNMKGVSKYYEVGKVDALAAIAGNDVLLFSQDVPKAVAQIQLAIDSGLISQEEIDRRVLKILRAKEWAGANDFKPLDTKDLVAKLNTEAGRYLKKQIIEQSLTVLENEDHLLPLKKLDTLQIASLTIGADTAAMEYWLDKYAPVTHFYAPQAPNPGLQLELMEKLEEFDLVLINIVNTNNSPSRNFGFSGDAMSFAGSIAQKHRVVLSFFGNPYALVKLHQVVKPTALIVAYQDDELTQKSVAELIFGAIGANGKLPVSIGQSYQAGSGLKIKSSGRLKYTSAAAFGLSDKAFAKIDSIALDGIEKKAYPGCQILVAKDGQVIYNKNFGYHTYENKQPVKSSDLYDLASITKIAASTISLMMLQDSGKFSLEANIGDYLPEIPPTSPYADVSTKSMLAHTAGFTPWIPFYTYTINKKVPMPEYYAAQLSDTFSVQVANNFYTTAALSDSINAWILKRPLSTEKDYKYSDIGFYFAKAIIEQVSGVRLDLFATSHFYRPLGLPTMGYLPLQRVNRQRIIPTEYDPVYRNQLIQGFVHDQGAAMQGGVGGHAGLFSNAEDLAVIMQMLLNKGEYGGERYLSSAVIEQYTKCQFCKTPLDKNRRGAGFDKPILGPGPAPNCKCISFESFGHSGFTGTMTWADPTAGIVYVFLSNRVYPTAQNNRLADMDIRTKIQAVIYEVLGQNAVAGQNVVVNELSPEAD